MQENIQWLNKDKLGQFLSQNDLFHLFPHYILCPTGKTNNQTRNMRMYIHMYNCLSSLQELCMLPISKSWSGEN